MCFFITVKFEERTTLYELKNQYEDPSSWFIGNTLVKSDGSLNIVTRYDPLYLLLPKMIEVSKDGKFHLIDQIESENFELIVSCLKSNKQLEKICDLSEAGEYRAYRYNEEKNDGVAESQSTKHSQLTKRQQFFSVKTKRANK